ncbi:hypothetical protein F2Q68_00027498 [Brassica cretica]|uniref:Uncharacterized protein n=2 Tax=Brassica cretica TaxID=69181 RepID=A0A3N6TDC8_BRACR|nr:hypothetical protein F2Q68_00027498 [Brassica cretica]KAF3577204.1 hypothetical protein DY000_02034459 [Brassica cretica]
MFCFAVIWLFDADAQSGFMGLCFQELKSSEVPVWSLDRCCPRCFLDLKEYKSGVEKLGSVKIPCSTISSRVCAVGKENTDLDTMVEVISYCRLVLLVTFDSVCFVSVSKVSISFLISDLVRLAPLMQGLVILESVIERSIVVLTDLGSGFLQ